MKYTKKHVLKKETKRSKKVSKKLRKVKNLMVQQQQHLWKPL